MSLASESAPSLQDCYDTDKSSLTPQPPVIQQMHQRGDSKAPSCSQQLNDISTNLLDESVDFHGLNERLCDELKTPPMLRNSSPDKELSETAKLLFNGNQRFCFQDLPKTESPPPFKEDS